MDQIKANGGRTPRVMYIPFSKVPLESNRACALHLKYFQISLHNKLQWLLTFLFLPCTTALVYSHMLTSSEQIIKMRYLFDDIKVGGVKIFWATAYFHPECNSYA